MVHLRKKILVVIYGAFFLFIALELLIRAGGFVFVSLQEHRNKVSIRQKGTYKIMCLGESTTAKQYPGLLEEILNQRNIGVKFSVIDKGVIGTNTKAILSRLGKYINDYKPDMVIVMAGCNDMKVSYYKEIPEDATKIFQNCRAYRFTRLIYMHILNKLNKKDAGFNPEDDKDYINLGKNCWAKGNFSQAESLFKKAVESDPKNDKTYFALGWFYRVEAEFSQAESSFKKAIELNPENDKAYAGLGWVYQVQNKLPQAESLFNKAIELNPENDKAYSGLGFCYRKEGKLPQAENSLKKAIELNPKNPRTCAAISVLYEEMGKPDLAKAYAEKADKLRLEYYKFFTANNYRKLKKILDKEGIKLVCMQYPMRNVDTLKKMFKGEEGVIFVDNENIFKEAVKKSGFKEIFADMFGGDFGHCTQKGNQLLAANIADVILKEVFHK